ncbi:MAG: hypothetical protein NC177_03640 [Ruminococcus flavefaciens]|nr:hypothetical protein [Ruminococcus flavefaciens]
MSRSYKKFPVVKDRCRTSKDCCKPKTSANRAVRHYSEIPTGKSCFFKKIYCSYDICDYKFIGYANKTEVLKKWKTKDYIFHDTYEEALWFWKKYYIRK